MATSTGIAMQGISAAIVYTAIDRISEMINTADAATLDRHLRRRQRVVAWDARERAAALWRQVHA